ncbi:polyprenyl synthetase family protein [Paenarthrobacter sp. Z7-10]|nr:polyprenyl synthetase family protein [Paenarthrobacter sp. Z7-10]
MQVNTVLHDFFTASRLRAHRLTPRFATLWEALQTTTEGGKRFRPRLVFTACDGLGGADLKAAAVIGAAFELLHTALIVHDDVVDRDFVRRGRPNVSGRYLARALELGLPQSEAEHRALSVGVVAGDLALFSAYRLIDGAVVSRSTRSRLLGILDDAVFASAAGELLDIEFSFPDEDPLIQDVVAMERLKTAVYSFEAPLKAGAVLAGAGADTIAGLGEIGHSMGIAYQIIDDLLGVFGDEAGTGKTTLGDVREGKRTVLMSHAAGQPEWAAIAGHLGNPELSREHVQEVRDLLTKSGSRAHAEQLAVRYADRARARIDCPDIPEPLRRGLEPMLSALLERSR